MVKGPALAKTGSGPNWARALIAKHSKMAMTEYVFRFLDNMGANVRVFQPLAYQKSGRDLARVQGDTAPKCAHPRAQQCERISLRSLCWESARRVTWRIDLPLTVGPIKPIKIGGMLRKPRNIRYVMIVNELTRLMICHPPRHAARRHHTYRVIS